MVVSGHFDGLGGYLALDEPGCLDALSLPVLCNTPSAYAVALYVMKW